MGFSHDWLALAEGYGVGRIHTGHRFISFEQSQDNVLVRFDNGATATGSALVGADGLWSRVRMQLLGDGRPRYRGDTAWRAIIPTPPDLTGFTESFETIGRGKRFGAMPIRGNRLLWFSGDVRPEGETDGPDVRRE